MILRIDNTPRGYAWGSPTAIADLLGRTPGGGPEAELWLGTHPGSPSRVIDTGDTLDAVLENPLPFLLKVLAAAEPLSLQVHPTRAEAEEGFARENRLGIPLDAAHRNYRDASPKPEILIALADGFEALAGFRPQPESRELLLAIGQDRLATGLEDLPSLVDWILTGGDEVTRIVDDVTARARSVAAAVVAANGDTDDAPVHDALDLVRRLAAAYPGDPGILLALLLNHVRLRRGDALHIPAGCMHAYLSGIGIELMTASDNVLRGGLTPKHVDIPELLRVLNATCGPAPRLDATRVGPGVTAYSPPDVGFGLWLVTADARLPLTGPAVALCVAGEFTLDGAASSAAVGRGDAVYISGDERALTVTGAGELYVASTSEATCKRLRQ